MNTSRTVIPMLCSMLLSAFAAAKLTAGQGIPDPDIVVARDGSGDFVTVQTAVESIPATNTDRILIRVKNGVYNEKVRVKAPFVTLRGESRKGVRLEYAQLNEMFAAKPDSLGRAVLNLTETAHDFVLENITVENTAGQIGPHAFALYGKANRTVILDSDVLSHGADTVSLWRGDSGQYYHANCRFRGSVDFVCPRGWCYITNCDFFEMKRTAAVWHDGRMDREMKFVLRDCRFDGTNGWNLARHHVDAQFYFLDCTFAATMRDQPPFRVIYPIGDKEATEADIQRNAELDKQNRWGERAYLFNCHREGGDYDWMADNLESADGAPTPSEITPAWTFAGRWDPERTDPPAIIETRFLGETIEVVLSEPATVKGHPRLILEPTGMAPYASGSGTRTLRFLAPTAEVTAAKLDLHGGTVLATEAGVQVRQVPSQPLPNRSAHPASP